MCRLAMFPVGFDRKDAIDILKEFEGRNDDGVGYTFLNKDGEFVCRKWPTALSKLLESRYLRNKFLDHMPHDGGWTIAHLRAASHGDKLYRNTHPFVLDDFAFIHNGVWSEYNIAASLMKSLAGVKVRGETDSEVAAHYFKLLGLNKFTWEVDRGGVFVALHKDGTLSVSKTSGDLVARKWQKKFLLASELSYAEYPQRRELNEGWYRFNKSGGLIKFKKLPSSGDNIFFGPSSFKVRRRGNIEAVEIDTGDVTDDDSHIWQKAVGTAFKEPAKSINSYSGLQLPSNYYAHHFSKD